MNINQSGKIKLEIQFWGFQLDDSHQEITTPRQRDFFIAGFYSTLVAHRTILYHRMFFNS